MKGGDAFDSPSTRTRGTPPSEIKDADEAQTNSCRAPASDADPGLEKLAIGPIRRSKSGQWICQAEPRAESKVSATC